LPAAFVARLWTAAAAGAAAGWAIRLAIPALHPVVTAILVLGPYGLVFLAMTFALGIPEAKTALTRVSRFKR
jgi:putative peptidoglycan lipid II flippase